MKSPSAGTLDAATRSNRSLNDLAKSERKGKYSFCFSNDDNHNLILIERLDNNKTCVAMEYALG